MIKIIIYLNYLLRAAGSSLRNLCLPADWTFMERKKVLWLCSWYPSPADPFNGDFIQRHARAAALFNDIYVIHVAAEKGAAPAGPAVLVTGKNGVKEEIISFKKKMTGWGRLLAFYQLQKLYRKAALNYMARYGLPDLVHVHVPIWAGKTAIWLQRKFHIPYVLTEHWGIYNETEQYNFQRKPALFRKYSKRIIKNAGRFISVSRFLAEGVNRLVIEKEFIVIPNVVDTAHFFYKQKTGNRFRFIHVSNMVPLKNVPGILRAFQQIVSETESELVLVGDTREDIRQYAEGLGFPPGRIRFCGEVSYENVAREMQAADALVHFSQVENSPCVISEALCCGLPVISSAVGGIPEMLDESNSMLVPAGDENALAGAMKKMILNYSAFNREAIAGSATERFNYPVIGRKLDQVYRDLSGDI
jgi:glycosyltransferase involved in cell wall biosynthesis